MSPDVTDILSRMQINCLKTVQLVGVVDICVVCFIVALDCVRFYLSPILHLVVIYVVPICVSRLSQTLSDWSIVT